MGTTIRKRSITATAVIAAGLRISRIAILVGSAGIANAQAPPDADLTIDYSTAGLSVHAVQVELEYLLGAIADSLGIAVISASDMPETISIEIRDEPVEEVFKRILRRHSYLLSFSTPWSGVPDESPNRLWVFSNGDGSNAGVFGTIDSPASTGNVIPVDLETITSIAGTIASASGDADGLARILTSIALDATSDAAREQAVFALGELELAGRMPALYKALEDPSPRIREAAIVSLGGGDDPETLARLANLLDDPDTGVREAAILALSEIGTNGALIALRNAASDPDPVIRDAASEAIAELDDTAW